MNINTQLLDNGLTIASDQMEGIETVSLVVLVKTGSCNETKANNGITHFLEHMAFKGTSSRSALAIASDFDLIGGHFNAYTSREKTVYYIKTLKKDFEFGVNIIADILQDSLFSEDEITREKDVVLQEIAQTNDAPDDIIFDLYHECAYPDQAFGRSILGTKEIIQNITRDQITAYVDQNYYAENMIISAAGNISHDYFAEVIGSKFNNLPKAGNKFNEDAAYIGGEVRVERNLEQVHIVLGFESGSCLHADYYSEQILSLIAGGGMSSRLFQEIREKRGLAYSVSAYSSNYVSGGMFNVYAATSNQKANECLDVITEQLFMLINTLTDEEISRAKSQICASIFMSLENSVSRAEKLSSNLSTYNRYIYSKEIMQKINEITKDDLIKVATRLFTHKPTPTFAVIGKLDNLYLYQDIKAKFK